MPKTLLLATTNPGKIREFKRLFEGSGIELLTPDREVEVEEKGCSFLENAYIKAETYHRASGIPTLADDSGLVVPALNGYPGIYSSRFYLIEFGGVEAVKESKDKANIDKLLRLMQGVEDRRAYFYACLVVYLGEAGLWAEGRCDGIVLYQPRGEGGFGYDPILQPDGYDRSMAELSPQEKDMVSHRGKAVRKLIKLIKMLE
ncbi:MAG: RdgB/HAM1 family non-canonical purine NTP pyrophosphatase [Aquificaceae bacterium]|nr:RdgB/HAM1 family non-canonical purine NTP pyrophosphatase [Aquificaceae bacterium]